MWNNLLEAETILSQITESLLVFNAKGDIVFFNRAAAAYTDLVPGPIAKGVSIYEIITADNLDIVRFAINDVIQTGNSHTVELVIKGPEGLPFFFEASFNPVNNDQSDVEFICLVARDITSQKTFERKTLQLVRELSSLIETANAIIFGIDAEEYITEWNRECIRITAYEKEDVLGKKIGQFLFDDQLIEFRRLLRNILEGQSVSNFQFTIGKKDDKPTTILLNGTPKTSGSGKVVGALFVGQDVTELMDYRLSLENKVRDRTIKLKEALQKEKELVEIKNKFVSIASHEFKVPLNAISASVEWLKRTADEGQIERLHTIETHVLRMKGLLEDILNVDKHESNKLKPNRKPVSIKDFLNGIMKEVADATQHTHRFVTSFPASDVVIQSDEKLLRNIFVNLLSNAVKFSPGEEKVIVDMKQNSDTVDIVVQDFGIGIEENEIDKVFEAFTRGSNTGQIKGTGLGLSIVKRAVESLSGQLAVKSFPSQGSTFRISFPIR